MSSLTCLYLFLSIPNAKVWSLSSSRLLIVKSFLLILSNPSYPILFYPSNFFVKSKIPSKAKVFASLVAHKKVNTNNKLQMRRSYKALSHDVCFWCMEGGETVDHLFLHCLLTLGLWYRLFRLANSDCIPPRSICDMMTISYKGLGSSIKGKVLWQIACLSLI